MIKYLVAALIVTALALGGLGWLYRQEVAQGAALRAQNNTLVEGQKQAQKQHKRNQAALLAKEREIAAQARKTAVAQEALKTALRAEKEWSDTKVPDSVQKALGGRSDGPVSVDGQPSGLLGDGYDNP